MSVVFYLFWELRSMVVASWVNYLSGNHSFSSFNCPKIIAFYTIRDKIDLARFVDRWSTRNTVCPD